MKTKQHNVQIRTLENQILEWGVDVLSVEAQGLNSLSKSLDHTFVTAVRALLACEGHVFVSGVGKSGHIAQKFASSLASTGTPAIYIHPTEAGHGDLGMITKRDLLIVLSKSGNSPELTHLLAFCHDNKIPIVGISTASTSTLANFSDYAITIPAASEACPHGLAPTTSTTMTLALCDAIALATARARNFLVADFRKFHPAGQLGYRLGIATEIMHGQNEMPLVSQSSTLAAAIIEMTSKRLGCVGVTDNAGKLIGIFTDGDLRRHFTEINLQKPITELMIRSPFQIAPTTLIEDVEKIFSDNRIPSVFICVEGCPIGIIHIHDLVQRKRR
jgi:arabinose-5-phosphate isomerase